MATRLDPHTGGFFRIEIFFKRVTAMNYEECLRQCVDYVNKNGWDLGEMMYLTYPRPSAEEWEACLAEVVKQGEDVSDAVNLMGEYELFLHKRGVDTGLGRYVQDRSDDFERRTGLPPEFLTSIFEMIASNATAGIDRKDRSAD